MPGHVLIGPLPHRVVEVRGADRQSYLEAVLSQRVVDLAAGAVRGSLWLDPQGRPQAVFDIVTLEDRLLLIVPDAALAEQVVSGLGGRTFLSDASFAGTQDAVLAVRGDDAHDGAAAAGLDAEPGRVREVAGVLVVGRREGVDLIGAGDDLATAEEQLRAAGARSADPAELEAERIAAGVPAWGHEITAPHLPEELGLLPTHVHLAKGCYPGQEAVARMWMLGRPRRRLAVLDLDDGVTAGWREGSGRRRVEVTSVAARDAARIGLGFVPADASRGDHLGPVGAGVTVRELVGEGLAVPGHDPAMRRRRDQQG